MGKIINIFHTWGKAGIISVLLVISFFAGNSTGFAKNNTTPQQYVLSATTRVTPSPTAVPTPTTSPITIINNIIFPTQTPATVNPVITPIPVVSGYVTPVTPTPQPKADGPLGPTPTPVLSPTASPTLTGIPTATPTPVPETVVIGVTYVGEHADSTHTVSITSGETAWQAVQNAVGIANIQYTDYGGNLGIFITGFNGVAASSDQYYDFQVNGTSSNVGVSSYIVNNHDVLKFVLTSF